MASQQNVFSLPLVLEGCQVHERLGSSPLGTLYRVSHPRLGNCALKYFKNSVAQTREFKEHFLAPVEKLAKLTHPNIARIYQVGKDEAPFILRELVLGTSLQEQLKIQGKFSGKEATQIVWDVTMGLLAGYPLGVVYKNIKPNNIILLPNNRVRLVDISLPPTYAGYVAPEQWENERSSFASDIYATGIVYYQALTGSFPFAKNNALPEDFLPGPDFDGLRDIVRKMLAKPLDKRYQSPLPLIKDLRNILQKQHVDVSSLSFSLAPSLDYVPAGRKTHVEDGRSTTMTVAFTQAKSRENDVKTTRKMSYEEYVEEIQKAKESVSESGLEEIYLSKRSLEKTLEKALNRMTHIEEAQDRKGPLLPRIIHFPKGFEQAVVKHLQSTFRRETWLLKDSETPGEMEIEIDLEQSYILHHFYQYEDKLQQALQEVEVCSAPEMGNQKTVNFERDELSIVPDAMQTVDYSKEEEKEFLEMSQNVEPVEKLETVTMDQDEVVCLTEMVENLPCDGMETINDITISGDAPPIFPEIKTKGGTTRRYRHSKIDFVVDFANAYQSMGWVKFVHEHGLKRGEHFAIIKDLTSPDSVKKFVIFLEKLEKYQKEQQNISRIKEFFQGDYEISELDRGGMGMVLKLKAKNDPTILSLRPENYWARQRFAPYLRIVKDSNGKEIIYAEIPKGSEFVVKVAFEGHEDSLVQEARILSRVAEDPHVCQTIIGSVQQGRLFTLDDKADQTQIGYYLMLEYAAQGDTERMYPRFPGGKLSPTIAFAIMYGMVQTLQKLKAVGIIHRDIKPHNILLDKNGMPKLSDFGLAITTTKDTGILTEERRRLLRVMDQSFLHISRAHEQGREKLAMLRKQLDKVVIGDEEHRKLQAEIAELREKVKSLRDQEEGKATGLKDKYRLMSAQENALLGKFSGSLYYAAPEQLNTEMVLTPACDLYQLGAVMFTLLTGKRPVEGTTSVEIMSRVLYPVKPEVSDYIKDRPVVEALSKIILKMMHHESEKRISVDEVREELDRILFEHALELKDAPHYQKPENASEEEDEKWARKVKLANELQEKCLQLIFSTIFQNQELPSLGKEVEKIVFKCPHCGKVLHLYRHMDGKRGLCPGCRKGMVVKLS